MYSALDVFGLDPLRIYPLFKYFPGRPTYLDKDKWISGERSVPVLFSKTSSPISSRRASGVATALVALCLSFSANAGPELKPAAPSKLEVVTSPTKGHESIQVRLDESAHTLVVRRCPAGTCLSAVALTIDIELVGELDVGASKLEVKRVHGTALVHAFVKAKSGATWEALIGAHGSTPVDVFHGRSGIPMSEPNERVAIEIHGDDVFVGALRRGVTLCGQEQTMLSPRRLDVDSMSLRAVAFSRLPATRRTNAVKRIAARSTNPALASVLGVSGASTHDGASLALVDDDPKTSWTEARRGDGRGEFVVLSSTKALPLDRIVITLSADSLVAPPSSVFLLVDDATYQVKIPDEPGGRFEVVFPTPVAASCVAVELDEAHPRDSEIAVGFAEIEGVPALPKTIASLGDLVSLLDGNGTDASFSRKVLGHGGARAAHAIEAKIGSLADRGKSAAVEILSAAPCAEAGPSLARLAWDAPRSVAAEARSTLDHCGRDVAKAVASEFTRGPLPAKEALGERLARLHPESALPLILDTLQTLKISERRGLRGALARLAETTAGRKAIVDWLAATDKDAIDPLKASSLMELARGVGGVGALGDARGPLSDRLRRVVPTTSGFDSVYRAAEPMAQLAKAGDVEAHRWMETLFANPSRELRVRATALSGEDLKTQVIAMLRDPEPRVRQQALDSLGRLEMDLADPTKSAAARWIPAASATLLDDRWTFVRIAAADAMAHIPRSGDRLDGTDLVVDTALGRASRDVAVEVRSAALRSLRDRKARGELPAVRSRAFDNDEATEVRRAAIDALGALCDSSSTSKLFSLADRSITPGGRLELGIAALLALGAIHPADLAVRLKSIDTSSLVVREAVRRALATTPCR